MGIPLNNGIRTFHYFLSIKIKDSCTLFIKSIISFMLSIDPYRNY
jgi:hypothetical protein